jgi:hypothetical protein
MSEPDWQIIKQGIWLYDDVVVCDIRIVKYAWRFGTGDCEDDEDDQNDQQGEFYYIQYGSTIERGNFSEPGFCCNSLKEAMANADAQTRGTVKWAS